MQSEIEKVIKDTDILYKELIEIGERVVFVLTLDKILRVLKNDIGELMDAYYNIREIRGNSLALSFVDGAEGAALYELFQAFYKFLDGSKEYYGHEFRKINGIQLEEIQGIDITALGIDTVVPRSLDEEGIVTSVSIQDFDLLRQQEISAIAGMTDSDAKMEFMKNIVNGTKGFNTDPIFEN